MLWPHAILISKETPITSARFNWQIPAAAPAEELGLFARLGGARVCMHEHVSLLALDDINRQGCLLEWAIVHPPRGERMQ